MRRFVSIVAVLLLCAALILPAQADTQYPSSQGAVTDLANVLREDTVKDVAILSERLHNATLGNFYVVTRHFLGGTDASVYAKALFDAWNLDDEDVLLLMVIGEEKYALAVGSAAKAGLSADTQTSLLASHFRSHFLNRNYDEAVADLSAQIAQALARAEGETINVSGLFGTAAIQSTPAPATGSYQWGNSYFSLEDFEDEDWPIDIEYSSHSAHFNWRGWLIWGLVIYFAFFRKKKSYNFGHGPRGRR
ncbi:MAG: TPM domain-containing protein [Clostridia bacterium]|nr:TPM domain-containing protein [Clostridia bacterium]